MTKPLITLLFTPLLTLAAPVSEKIKTLYSTRCANCHQSEGQGASGFTPKLAGQYSMYLKNQILDIRDGRRTNGSSTMMVGIFKTLSDEEIDSIVNYVSKLDE